MAARTGSTAAGTVGIAAGTGGHAAGWESWRAQAARRRKSWGAQARGNRHHGDHKHHRGGHHGHHRNYGWFGPAFYGYGYGYGYPYYYYYGPYPYYGAYPTVYRRYVIADYYALVVSVQKALARRGYYRGPIDGIIGKGTRRAILAYRADNGLRVISRIDNELLKALG